MIQHYFVPLYYIKYIKLGSLYSYTRCIWNYFFKKINKSNITVVLVIRNCKTHLLAPNYSNMPSGWTSPTWNRKLPGTRHLDTRPGTGLGIFEITRKRPGLVLPKNHYPGVPGTHSSALQTRLKLHLNKYSALKFLSRST